MKENSKEIAISDASKSITIQEMEAVITALKSRQKFFQEAINNKKESEEKLYDKLKAQLSEAPEDIKKKIILLSSEFAKNMDQKFFKDFEEELEVQEGINEFLFKFTGEPQTNYKNLFLETKDLSDI